MGRANEEIVRIRNDAQQRDLPGAAALQSAVADEVDYIYFMWDGRYDDALEMCRRIVPKLDGKELRGYDGFWMYLAGCAAWLSAKKLMHHDLVDIANDYFTRASRIHLHIAG